MNHQNPCKTTITIKAVFNDYSYLRDNCFKYRFYRNGVAMLHFFRLN